MNRRVFLKLPLAAAGFFQPDSASCAADETQVVPGRVLRFPEDEGSHPNFKIEWWYVTGWLYASGGAANGSDARPQGFQITFFRSRAFDTRGNPSRFAPEQVLLAHAALADPQRGHLLTDQRIERAGFGLAEARPAMTDVLLDGWLLRAQANTLHAYIKGADFAFDFALRRTQPPMLQGEHGYSRKGAAAQAASYYYSLPHLAVDGSVFADGRSSHVTGKAWFDHEWSMAYMEPEASGWDWIGINLDDGGALMAFRMRSSSGTSLWAGATHRDVTGRTRSYPPSQIMWRPLRIWRSGRTGTSYPVAWQVRVGELVFELEPLMEDQENDARASSNAVYWEGAVSARAGGRIIGRGYLELTGYWRTLKL